MNFCKRKNNFKDIGKKIYDFNFEEEKIIYSSLCCQKTNKNNYENILMKLNKGRESNNQYTFRTYTSWKKYIMEKYRSKNYPLEKLIDFSAYLNWGYIRLQPGHEGWNILSTAYLTLTFTKLTEIGISSFKTDNICSYIIMFFIMPVIYIIVANIISPFYNNSIIENLYIDYKKIIDELIKEKDLIKQNDVDRKN